MKQLTCTASKLTVRATPGGLDTGLRILEGQSVQGHGESYDRAWVYVTRAGIAGWASVQYLDAEVAAPAPVAGPLKIIPRAAWGARGGVGLATADAKPLVVVHHFAAPDIPEGASEVIERAALLGVEKTHLGKGWDGIGYNFIGFASGRLYEGRGWGRVGAHADGANSKSLGYAFAINGEAHEITPRAIATFRAWTAEGIRRGNIVRAFQLKGHRDVNTDTQCPGDLLYAQLAQLKGG